MTTKIRVNTKSLDGLRGCAALQVALGHIFMASSFGIDFIGGNAMPLFFLVSGFVMVLGYGQNKYCDSGGMIGECFCYPLDKMKCCGEKSSSESEGQPFALKEFFVKRIARLGPMYYTTNLAGLPLVLGSGALITGVLTLFLLTSWTGFEPFNGVTWTISTMTFFYLCFPLLIVRLQNMTTIKDFKVLSWKMYFLQIILFVVMSLMPDAGYEFWRLFPPCRLPVFVMGCCIGHIRLLSLKPSNNNANNSSLLAHEEEKHDELKSERTDSKLTLLLLETDCTTPTIIYVLIMFVGMALSGIGMEDFAWIIRMYCEPLLPILLFDWIIALTQPVPSTVISSTHSAQAPSLSYVQQALESRCVQFLGHISMSFYMVHELVLTYVTMLLHGEQSDDDEQAIGFGPSVYTILIVLTLSLILGWLCTEFIEIPVQKSIIRRCLPQKSQPENDPGFAQRGAVKQIDMLERLVDQQSDKHGNDSASKV